MRRSRERPSKELFTTETRRHGENHKKDSVCDGACRVFLEAEEAKDAGLAAGGRPVADGEEVTRSPRMGRAARGSTRP